MDRSMYERREPLDYEMVPRTTEHPFGQPEPEGGFQIDDYVALVYADHEEYVFDNPVGFVVAVEKTDDGDDRITVEVQGTIDADRVLLMARPTQA